MPQYVYVFVQAFVLSLLLTPLVRAVARAVGAVDNPGERSVHRDPVPCLGGIALYASFAITTFASGMWDIPSVQGLLLGGLAILVVGVVDDLVDISPGIKLMGQAAAALILVSFGTRIGWVTNPWGGLIVLGYWSIPVTMIWVVAFANVLNLIDGLDGLAAGIAGIASLTLLLVALRTGQPWLAIGLVAALAGSIFGFLPYNFNPAKIFMGDGGALFLGFALAGVSADGLLKSTAAIAIVIPMLVLGVPILDTAFAIHRRWRRGLPVHGADKDHLHHRLLRLGLSHRQAVLTMYGVSVWLGMGALAMTEANVSQGLFIVLFSGVFLYLCAKRVGVFDLKGGRHLRQ